MLVVSAAAALGAWLLVHVPSLTDPSSVIVKATTPLLNNTQFASLAQEEIVFTLNRDLFAQLVDVVAALVAVIVLIRLVPYLYKQLFTTLEVHKELGEVPAFTAVGAKNAKNSEDAARLRKRIGDMPPPFPNGWFNVCVSCDLKKGEVKDVSCLGLDLAMFRDENGKVAIMDKYCPHLGANLAVGGVVKGGCIECPFHGWQFSSEDGAVTKVAYAAEGEKLPKVKATKYHCIERAGMIMLWHDAEGRDPMWMPPDEYEDFVYHGKGVHYVGAHCQEIPENGADVPHLNILHPPFVHLPRWLPWFTHWFLDPVWTPGDDGENGPKHIAVLNMTQTFCFRGRVLDFTKLPVAVRQIGPGLVFLEFTTVFGQVLVVETVVPEAPMRCKTFNIAFAERKVPRFVAKYVLNGLITQFERDVPIWCAKKYEAKPQLLRGDRGIPQFRRWFGQFFSEHSKTYDELLAEKTKCGDW